MNSAKGVSLFCDFITLHQWHENPQPIFNSGFFVSFEASAFGKSWQLDEETGEVTLKPVFDATQAIYTTSKRVEHEGSFDTALQVRSDGHLVELSGNVSRFGRTDNLFGLSVADCITKANEILEVLGISPFSENADMVPMAKNDTYASVASCARITRIDLTQNYCAGSKPNALRFIHAMAGQAKTTRGKGNGAPKGYGNGCTWGEGSKRIYTKLYYKADDLGKYVTEEVKNLCEQLGVVRFEVSLKSRELADLGANRILNWCRLKEGKEMAQVIYDKFSEVLRRNQVSTLDITDLPGKLGLLASDYLNGGNPFDKAPGIRTAQRWRKSLLPYGIDIKVPCNVTRLAARCVVIEIKPLEIPDWYSVDYLKNDKPFLELREAA